MLPKLLTEAVGTFLLMLVIGLSSLQFDETAPLAIGFALMALVHFGGHVSGAHYNPATSIAFWIRGGFPAREVLPYVAAQFLGAVAAAMLTYKFLGVPLHIAPDEGVSIAKAIAGEAVMSFFLIAVILNVATARATQDNHYAGLAIGGAVTACIYAMATISGGAFNPAVGLASALVEIVVGNPVTGEAWIYLAGPLAGGVAAASVFKLTHPGE